jgi:hypothetical protein
MSIAVGLVARAQISGPSGAAQIVREHLRARLTDTRPARPVRRTARS